MQEDGSLLDILDEYLDDDAAFFEDCLVVRDHNTAQLVPFRMRYGQRILHAVAEKQAAEQGYVRIFLLKSRRFGGSTYVEGRIYKRTSMYENRNAFIVAHEVDSTETLFRMAKLFHERNPIAPATLASNAKELRFDNEDGTGLKSEYKLATAKNIGAGRSQGIHYLHISEEAYFPDGADSLLVSLFNCFPEPPTGTEIFRESTANGYGNTFAAGVLDAYCGGRYPYYSQDGITFAWHNPKRDWVLVFIPWFIDDNLERPFRSAEEKQAFKKKLAEKEFDEETMTWVESEASRLGRKYNLSLEKLNWRAWAIENKCEGSVDKFHQDFPSDVLEAFLSRGTNVYSKGLCDDLEKQCSPPVLVGDINRVAGEVEVKRNKHGNLSIWEKPDRKQDYFITVDTAGGLGDVVSRAVDKKDDEPDKTNIDVWNRRTGNQAAQWNGHIDYDLIDNIIVMLGEYYSHRGATGLVLPTACVELNNHGYTVVAGLKRRGYPQYGAQPGKPGWSTNRGTKHQMIDDSRRLVRDGTLKINCISTVAEMRTYLEEGGHYGAAAGCNDDRVITMSLAGQMMFMLPKKPDSRGPYKPVGFSNAKALTGNNSGGEVGNTGYVEYYT